MGAIENLRDRGDEVKRRAFRVPRIRRAWRWGVDYVGAVQRNRVTGLAAEVAFYAVLSIFPSILALASTLGMIDSLIGEDAAQSVQNGLVSALDSALGADAGSITAAVEALFDEPSPGLLGLGLVLVVFTASRGFNAVIKALDVVYEVGETRGLVKTRALALALAGGSFVVGAVVLAMLVLGPLFGQGVELAEQIGLGQVFVTLWTWVRPPLLVVFLTVWAATLFHLAPNHRSRWVADLPGAVVTMALWMAGAVGFRIYLAVASNDANAVLGALGGGLTLLLWLYVMGLALLLGAEVNALNARRRRARMDEGALITGERIGPTVGMEGE
ncbi:MAG: YihY/virulence factor BrkB family protein [Acidimicrobiales bacterium]